MNPEPPSSSPFAPVPDSVATSPPSPQLALRPLARWRWWVYLLIVGSYPLLIALSSTLRAPRSAAPGGEAPGITLPASLRGLWIAGAIEIASLLLFFGLAWLFTRPNRDQLWWRWRGGLQPIWRGALYSVGLRLLPVLPFIAIGVVLTLFGVDAKTLEAWISQNKPQTEGLGEAMRAGSPLYKLTMLTFFSFGVAGLREELWRVATMRGLLEVAPRGWSAAAKSSGAVVVSAVVFGVGHWYQGVVGVGVTALIGLALGAITLHHRSAWPAIIAHGCFDAATFLMVVLGADKLAK